MSDQSNANVAPIKAKKHPIIEFREQVEARRTEFKAALPAHIPEERFARVLMTAVSQTTSLLMADRASLLTAAMKCAADGLLPDGREAALVIYKDRVQYMPMVAGILKKVRNSGELQTIVARVVYGGDKFRNWIDDTGEHIEYEASPDADRNMVLGCFAMAKLKDGAVEVEWLTTEDVEKIRNVSRAKDKGPWVDWWDEMAKKSAIRRLSKRLPLNTDLDDLIRRDDALYNLEGAREEAAAGKPLSLAGKLAALTGKTDQPPLVAAPAPAQPETVETRAEAASPAPATDTPPKAEKAAGAHPKPAKKAPKDEAEQAEAELLANLMNEGSLAADEGGEAFEVWLASLTGDEAAYITPSLLARWRKIADKADVEN